ncbi:MAG TPA: hypothetical protein VFR84_06015 [Candidatus Angelobacter sp.]|nr:hypothetical protein [Candidatus Angelobacter sp.]
MLYPGETIRLLRAISASDLPQFAEGRVVSVCRNEDNEPIAVEAEFHRDSQTIKAEVPLVDVELVIADSQLRQTAAFWGLELPPEKVIEAAMHSLLDSGFVMRAGLNLVQLHYDRENRWWKWGEKLTDPTGALVATAAATWDGFVVAFSGRQRFHLEFRQQRLREAVLMLHERHETYLEQIRTTHPAMSLMRVLLNLSNAIGARYCAFPVAAPWIYDQDLASVLRPPLYPDFLLVPEKELPRSISTPFRLIRLTGKRAILTVLPVKSSPTETGFERSERELKLDHLRKCKALGEKYYDQMYETRFGTSGLYADAKDAFHDAIAAANELGLKEEAAELEKRLDHIKGVYRSQFL